MSARPSKKDPKIPETVPFGVLEDSLFESRAAVGTLEQLAALFRTIAVAADSQDLADDSIGIRDHIKALAGLGQYVAEDRANILGADQERTLRDLGVEA